jgi:outer membrane receptor protein involved in Fe transport
LEREFSWPKELTTQRLPISFSYHWPSGVFLDVDGVRIDQEYVQYRAEGKGDFWNVDAVLGYRFPKRNGKIEIIVKNLLDKEFNYYDMSNFFVEESMMPQYQPVRQLFARFTLNF